MKESKIETTIGLCVVALSKFLMKKYSVPPFSLHMRTKSSQSSSACSKNLIFKVLILMKKYSVSEEEAYQRLMEMELYELLLDADTRLYLEPN